MILRASTLAIIATAATPFTELRVGPIGIGEIIFAALFFHILTTKKLKFRVSRFPLTSFWIIFILTSLVGMILNITIFHSATGTLNQTLFDFLSYLFVASTCYALEILAQGREFNGEEWLKKLLTITTICFTVLFLLSTLTETLGVFRLRHAQHFAPLAENLHQTALFLVPLPFFAIHLAAHTKTLKGKILATISPLALVVFIYETGSSKAILGLFFGISAVLYSLAWCKLNYKERTLLNLILLIVGIIIFAWSDVFSFLIEAFHEADPSGDRAHLYPAALSLGLDSPLVGRGPGAHVLLYGDYHDVHQTFLTAFVQAGLVGFTAFSLLTLYILRKSLTSPGLFGALAAISIYSLGGDILRRLPVWVMMFLIISITTRNKIIKQTEPI